MAALTETLELALKAFAFAYAEATKLLNPYSEAIAVEPGFVYTGTLSSVHGLYGISPLNLDPKLQEEAELFFQTLERNARYSSWSQEEEKILAQLQKKEMGAEFYRALNTIEKKAPARLEENIDPGAWAQNFTKLRKGLNESDLYAQTLMHMKNIRFAQDDQSAAFAFFSPEAVLLESYGSPLALESLQQFALRYGAKQFFLFTPNSKSTEQLLVRKLWE